MTDGKLVTLTDGTTLEVNINFATIYYMQKSHINRIIDKAKKRDKTKDINKLKFTDDESMDMAAKMIYALMRSNGRQVTFDEALMLCPADTEEIKALFSEFDEKMKKYKKKETARMTVRKQ